ncbi:nitroreductase family protein [Trichomonas vaginalis G3]|uniref:Nitroreductase family protein n=1 Tax=Trichomonas vaginalis (strain ATCC PRA-98 / G3) TaxID=412133 RepID=A2EPP9_TRIV3|nr:nitroreductase family protein [Trichomonas vaginalis G3]EAY05392.1 nitroreductase family protein [Trichomonas vaginalis G3]KAI5524081.1 nitroreductase family protein [Trichomonas vaginalis G3]|eukprot:XP_001317615.1 nitroreductase family protein [Trichomonas vaginalis G3]
MALAALKHRRTIRNFDPNYVIPKEQLTEIVNMGLNSPSAKNLQSIDLVVITNKKKIKELNDICYSCFPKEVQANFDMRKGKYAVSNTVVGDAPCVILLVKNERAEKWVQVDAGMMLMSLIVAAQEFKLESLPMGSVCHAKVEEHFGLKPGSLLVGLGLGKVNKKPIVDNKTILSKVQFVPE